MRIRALLPFLLVVAAQAPAFAQDKASDVLADGDPPLTRQMASDYMRFMQWALRTPLTIGQENRLQSFLIDNWKAANNAEITRTLNILALREQIQTMDLSGSQWAAYQTGLDALRNWRASENMEMARWGLAFFKSSHTALVQDDPALTRQMEDAYEEIGYFMMNEVDGRAPLLLDAVERTQLADTIARSYPQLSPEQRTNFALLPRIWVQVRNAWPTLDDATKASLRSLWKANFNPAPAPPAKGTKPPPAPKVQPTINRLVAMTWVLKADVFGKMSSVGTPYGIGW